MSTRTLPEHCLRLMSAEERAKLGKGGMTQAEAEARWARGAEKQLHDLLATDLQRRGIPFLHARMDKKSPLPKGWPDFTVLWQGRSVCIEFKAEGGALSREQETKLAELAQAGVPVLVAWSLGAALDFLRRHLLEATPTTQPQ